LTQPELAIRLRGVVKRYGVITAVDGLDLDVPEGTCVGLLGPNGVRPISERFELSHSRNGCTREPSDRLRSPMRVRWRLDFAGRV
jgi:hypothetical protein